MAEFEYIPRDDGTFPGNTVAGMDAVCADVLKTSPEARALLVAESKLREGELERRVIVNYPIGF